MQGPVFEAMTGRRSAKAHALEGPPPDRATVERIVLAAVAAPDHGLLVPFRVVEIPGDRREALADAFERAAFDQNPDADAETIAKARDKALRGPLLLALIARIADRHPKIPATDQWLTVGAAMQNMVLAAEESGLGVALRSGRALESAALRAAFALAEGEHLVTFLAIGRSEARLPDRRKPAIEAILARF
jgi:nitroreductase